MGDVGERMKTEELLSAIGFASALVGQCRLTIRLATAAR